MITSYLSPETATLPRRQKRCQRILERSLQQRPCDYLQQKQGESRTQRVEEDTCQPRWKGDFSIDTECSEWFYALQKIYGDEAATKLLSAYVQNGGQMRRGGTLQSQLVAAGESAAPWAFTSTLYTFF